MTNRRSLSESPDASAAGPADAHAVRRGESRTEASERIVVRRGEALLDAWTLNISAGGMRLVLEDKVALGDILEIRQDTEVWRAAQVVWIQEEPDGAVVGVEYTDSPRRSSMPPRTPPTPTDGVKPDGT